MNMNITLTQQMKWNFYMTVDEFWLDLVAASPIIIIIIIFLKWFGIEWPAISSSSFLCKCEYVIWTMIIFRQLFDLFKMKNEKFSLIDHHHSNSQSVIFFTFLFVSVFENEYWSKIQEFNLLSVWWSFVVCCWRFYILHFSWIFHFFSSLLDCSIDEIDVFACVSWLTDMNFFPLLYLLYLYILMISD